MSKEHLWPQWARQALHPDDRARLIEHLIDCQDGTSRREWLAPVFSATLKDVCVACNTGWMSQIEAIAKDLALPLVRGEHRFLDQKDQMLISGWSYMKILVLERADRRQQMIPKRRYQRVFAAAQRGGMTVPPTASVFIAAHIGALAGQYQHRGLLPRGSTATRPDLFVGTFTIGHLVVQVIENLEGPGHVIPERETIVEGRDRQIWPPTKPNRRIWPPGGGIRWPPPAPFSDLELAAYSGPLPGQEREWPATL
jgi:hypothetical protein